MGEHSAETKSQKSDLLQPVFVSGAKRDRTVLQQDQAVSACRDPIRQTRGQLLAFVKLASIRIWLRANEAVP